MRGRGRILQALSKASQESRLDQGAEQPPRSEDGPPVQSQGTTPPPSTSTRGVRGLRSRGGFILNRIREAGDQPTNGPPATSSSSTSSGGSTSGSRLSRQNSEVGSRGSVISEQFATIESIPYKADLTKEPSGAGEPVKLGLNYMTFSSKSGATIEAYHINFNPNIESMQLRYRLLRSEQAREVIGEVMHWNGTNLYLPHRLPDNETTLDLVDQGRKVQVMIRYVKRPPEEELISFYNSLMHKVMNRLHYVIINRQHYSPAQKIEIAQHKLEVWPGWITSIQHLDGGLKLSVDASFRVLRLETVRDVLLEIRQRCRGTGIKEAFEQELVGSIVMTRYNNKSYRIDGVDLGKNPTHTFKMTRNNDQVISYVDYLREHWDQQVRDLQQPLLIHKPKPKRGQEDQPEIIYLVPEVCTTTGLTDEMRSNFTIMKAVGDHTRLPPDVRESKLTEFLQQLATDERASSVLKQWNLSVNPTLDVVDGRRLDTETIIFGNNRTVKVQDNADWTRPATQSAVLKPVDTNEWLLLVTERDFSIADDFLRTVQEVSRQFNIKFSKPRIVKLPNDATTTYVNAAKKEVKRTDQMVVIMTPGRSQREDRYSAMKRLLSCEYPIPCQFIRCGTVSNPAKIRSIVQKIVIQILCKVGGQPWGMKLPIKNFMIVGIDVYHDTIDRRKSCLGFIASTNPTVSAWWSDVFFQNSLEEIGQKLSGSLTRALDNYLSENGCVPSKIIIYRDGVGDSQLESVLRVEIAQLMNAIKFYMRDDKASFPLPQVSYVVVQKRINAKLSLRASGRTMNPPPGTYIDHTITHPEYNDFYLVSQHVNQGTVNPTKYIVLTETGTLKPEHHQKLAYKMTHMYYNWMGTVRVPAPCQYAHKLAYLCGESIRQQPSERLCDKLYFL